MTLVHLPDIADSIKGEPYRFIVFSDDVSFEVGDSSYKMLKVPGRLGLRAPGDAIYPCHLQYETDNRGAMLFNNEITMAKRWRRRLPVGSFRAVGRFSSLQPGPVPGGCQAMGRKRLRACGRTWQAAILWSQQKGDCSGRCLPVCHSRAEKIVGATRGCVFWHSVFPVVQLLRIRLLFIPSSTGHGNSPPKGRSMFHHLGKPLVITLLGVSLTLSARLAVADDFLSRYRAIQGKGDGAAYDLARKAAENAQCSCST